MNVALHPPAGAASVRVEGLSHRYRRRGPAALCDVSFAVQPGERLGLLGPNGAGKTTLMRLLCGYLPVQHQQNTRVEVGGGTVDRAAVRARVGYLPEQVPLHQELRVYEHLAFRARVKRVPRRSVDHEVRRVATLADVEDVLGVSIFKLSRGYRQRVGIADALLGSPPLVVLDEPTVGLDPNQVLDMRETLRTLGGSQTLIFSSHILAEVEALCDRVVILDRGRVVVRERLEDAMQARALRIEWDGAQIDVARTVIDRALARVGLEIGVEIDVESDQDGGEQRVSAILPCSDGRAFVRPRDLQIAIGRLSVEHGLVIVGLEPTRPRLEQRFAAVTGARSEGAP